MKIAFFLKKMVIFLRKMTIFMKKNEIFIFLKTPIKEGPKKKKKIIALDTFFNFLLCFFLKKNKKGKSWAKKLGL
jgi:hypothetical protein